MGLYSGASTVCAHTDDEVNFLWIGSFYDERRRFQLPGRHQIEKRILRNGAEETSGSNRWDRPICCASIPSFWLLLAPSQKYTPDCTLAPISISRCSTAEIPRGIGIFAIATVMLCFPPGNHSLVDLKWSSFNILWLQVWFNNAITYDTCLGFEAFYQNF